MAFFESALVHGERETTSDIPKCGACGLYKNCKSPKMPVTGWGRRRILVVAEAPGEKEDQLNRQLVGPSGQLLKITLRQFGLELERDCWKTNAIICRPEDNAKPTPKQIEYCRPNLLSTIRKLQPRSIIALGGTATKSLFEPLNVSNAGSITVMSGWRIPSKDYGCWVCPTWHPAYLLREEDPALSFWFRKHIRAATRVPDYEDPLPDFEDQVKVLFDPDRAAKAIRWFVKQGMPTAFDFETNCLKPDGPKARIVCCSLSNGDRTVAYPMVGDAVDETIKFLRSPVPKLGANIKFEDRWSRAVLKTGVRNWKWDTVQAAHLCDNRHGITSVKFQAFVLFGIADYNNYIEPFLRAKDSRSENRIREADLGMLLRYCGIDSLLEFHIAQRQMKMMEMS